MAKIFKLLLKQCLTLGAHQNHTKSFCKIPMPAVPFQRAQFNYQMVWGIFLSSQEILIVGSQELRTTAPKGTRKNLDSKSIKICMSTINVNFMVTVQVKYLGGFYYVSRFNDNTTKSEGNMIKLQSLTKVGSS